MKKIILILTLLFFAYTALAQTGNIEIRTGTWTGTKLYQNDIKLSSNQADSIFSYDAEVFKLYRKGINQIQIGNLFTFTGGFLVGYTLGSLIGGGEPDGVLVFLGVTSLVVGYPIVSSGSKKLKKAVNFHNTNFQNIPYNRQEEYSISIKNIGNRIGLFVTF